MPVQMCTWASRFTPRDLEHLLDEVRDDLVNALDAMGTCPHEGVSGERDLCNACAADTAVHVIREVLDAERV